MCCERLLRSAFRCRGALHPETATLILEVQILTVPSQKRRRKSAIIFDQGFKMNQFPSFQATQSRLGLKEPDEGNPAGRVPPSQPQSMQVIITARP